MDQDTDQLKREIEDTRRELAYDVDALTEKVSPQRVVGRRVEKVKTGIAGLRDKVMGAAEDATSAVQSTVQSGMSSVAEGSTGMTSTASDAAGDVVSAVRDRAEGNPLAAGIVAFGLGWLVASLIPASEREAQLASTVTDAAKSASEPVKEQLSSIVSDVRANMAEPAREAVESVKSTAEDALSTVQEDARSAASDVRDDAMQAGQNVRGSSGTPSDAV